MLSFCDHLFRDPYIIYLNIALSILSMVVSLYVGGKGHVSNGQNVSFKEPWCCGWLLRKRRSLRHFGGIRDPYTTHTGTPGSSGSRSALSDRSCAPVSCMLVFSGEGYPLLGWFRAKPKGNHIFLRSCLFFGLVQSETQENHIFLQGVSHGLPILPHTHTHLNGLATWSHGRRKSSTRPKTMAEDVD